MYSLYKRAKLREVGFIGLAEAELLDKGSQNSAGVRSRMKRTGKSREEGTGKARGKLSLLPGESQETGLCLDGSRSLGLIDSSRGRTKKAGRAVSY